MRFKKEIKKILKKILKKSLEIDTLEIEIIDDKLFIKKVIEDLQTKEITIDSIEEILHKNLGISLVKEKVKSLQKERNTLLHHLKNMKKNYKLFRQINHLKFNKELKERK